MMNTYLKFNAKYSVAHSAGKNTYETIANSKSPAIPDDIVVQCLRIIHEAQENFDVFLTKYSKYLICNKRLVYSACSFEIVIPDNETYYLKINFQNCKISDFTITSNC